LVAEGGEVEMGFKVMMMNKRKRMAMMMKIWIVAWMRARQVCSLGRRWKQMM